MRLISLLTSLFPGYVAYAFVPSDISRIFSIRQQFEKISSVSLSASLTGKHFQLEELEDKESCVTGVFLKEDNTLVMGITDGPIPVRATGTWEEGPDGSVKIFIERTFNAGISSSDPTEMGEFEFTVSRTMIGEITAVGENLAVGGKVFCEDIGDVGFFNLIDTTGELQLEGKKLTS